MPNTLTRVPKTAWTHRRRFNVTAANDDRRYYEQSGDIYDSMSRWDAYNDSPTDMTGSVMAGSAYIVPIKCYLASYEAIAYSGSANDRPFQIEIYYGTPTLDSGSNTTLALAAVSNGVTSHDVRREPERLYEDWGTTITLDQGDAVVPTVKSVYDGINGMQGTITIFFKEF
tara:strand:+ start:298 stop:810 length:513 start_codon:yes stop_codon:yes gene_type:complete